MYKKITLLALSLIIYLGSFSQVKMDTIRPNSFTTNPCAKNTIVTKLKDFGAQCNGYSTGNNDCSQGSIVGNYAYFQNITLPKTGIYIQGIGFRTKNDSPNNTTPTFAGIHKFTFGETPCSHQPIGKDPDSGARSEAVPLNKVKDNGYTYYAFNPPFRLVVSNNIYATLILPQGKGDMMAVYHTDFMQCPSSECNVWQVTNQPTEPNTLALPSRWYSDYSYSDQNGNKHNADIDLDMYIVYSTTVDINDYKSNTTNFTIISNMQEKQLTITNSLNDNRETQMLIYSTTGQLIKKQTFTENAINIDLKDIKTGIYIVKLVNESETLTQKIIVQ